MLAERPAHTVLKMVANLISIKDFTDPVFMFGA
jgi:hypothetical protein